MKNETDALKAAIIALEKKSADEFIVLKQNFSARMEALRPINLIKNTFTDVANSTEIKESVVSGLAGMTAGFFTKKLFVGSSSNPLKRILGSVIQFTTARLVSKHAVDIGNITQNLVNRFLTRKEDNENQA
jgi:hypothetical protein